MWPPDQAWRAPVGDFPPRWASAWGDDRYGLWADLVVGNVTQRMRWIEPTGAEGFWMGCSAEQLRRWQGALPRNQDGTQWASSIAPAHRVMLSKGFWLADTPCTQAMWREISAGGHPSAFGNRRDSDQHPVDSVSFLSLSKKLQLGLLRHGVIEPGSTVALPTEAEWEYACRAGSDSAYSWGDGFSSSMAHAGDSALQATCPVKRFPPNQWGLYDMHGNVWEVCADGLRPYSDEAVLDPKGSEDFAVDRAIRGGAWNSPAFSATSFSRSGVLLKKRSLAVGFRIALRWGKR